jgi:16S rRNA (guanine527-N7)-methyltransferase
MPENNYTSIIKHFCEKYNIELEEKVLSDFSVLTDELLKFNSHTNLTAVRDARDVAIKHHADSLSLLSLDLVKENSKIIDVGCGAGFPGLPLKTARRDIDISFLDSTEKKLKFTSHAASVLGFDASVYPLRAEDAAKDKKLREGFDIAVSRAMANLPVLCELCMPFVKKGGYFVAYKWEKASDMNDPESELSRSKNAISQLGGKLEDIFYYDLSEHYENAEDEKKHCLIIIKKVKNTPGIYPRRYPQILKKPL